MMLEDIAMLFEDEPEVYTRLQRGERVYKRSNHGLWLMEFVDKTGNYQNQIVPEERVPDIDRLIGRLESAG